jgi:hypothetical protein
MKENVNCVLTHNLSLLLYDVTNLADAQFLDGCHHGLRRVSFVHSGGCVSDRRQLVSCSRCKIVTCVKNF